MKWHDLLSLVGAEPVFESSMLLAGDDPPHEVRRQLARWTAAGRLLQLRRGLYALAPPHAKVAPVPFSVANRLRPPSYVSLESALAYHGVIPESTPAITSVTTRRPGRIDTPLGTFSYRHIHRSLFWGYRYIQAGQEGGGFWLAWPEKALLDLCHLHRGPITEAFLGELRLHEADGWSDERLGELARQTGRPKLIRAARRVARLLQSERNGEERL